MKPINAFVASMLLFLAFQGSTSAQVPQREGFSAISWNGKYFLIGTYDGDLVKFDGRDFVLAANLNSSITEIVNFSGNWIIGGEGFLGKYNGKLVSPILEGEGARMLACNAWECLIYTSTRKLYSYDGKALAELTSEMKEELQGEYIVTDILFDGREWLILTKEANIFGNGTLLRYEGGKLSRVDLPIHVAHIASNDVEWLLIEAKKEAPYNLWLYRNGDLSKVDVPLEKFAAEQPPVKLSIDKIAWSGGAWLICASYGEHQRALRFDEESIATVEEECEGEEAEETQVKALLPAGAELIAFGIGGEEWLIAGKSASGLLTFYRYRDGKLDELPAPPVKLLRVDTIAYGDGYWLIGAISKPGIPPPPGTPKEELKVKPPLPVLLKFDGNAWEEIPLPEEGVTPSTFNVVPAWNGEYWLIALYDPNLSPVFYRFNGMQFSRINVTTDLLSVPQPPWIRFFPKKVAWGSDYWLMDTGYSLIKYDGEFTVAEYQKGIYSPYRIRDMKWNGRYWLVLYLLAGTEGSAIIKYDGSNFELLPYKPTTFATRQWPPISDVEWGSGYWLIGTYRYVHTELPENVQEYMKPSLLKYDGVTFTDLTNEFEGGVSSRVALELPRSPPPPPPTDGRILVFLAITIFVFLIILALIWKRKSKGAVLGAIWGVVGLIIYIIATILEISHLRIKIPLRIVEIIALPSVIWAKIAYQLGGGGSVYYNPLIVLLLSVFIGAVIGYGIEKGYQKVKGKR